MIYNISPFPKENCYNIWKEPVPNVNQIADIENLGLPINSQETILTTFAISTVNDPLVFLRSMYAFIKPKGALWIYDWDFEIIARKYLSSELTCGQLNTMYFNMKRMIDRNHLIEMLISVGFKEFVEFYDKNDFYPEKGENELILKAIK